MAGCCEGNKTHSASGCCGAGGSRTVLIYACSGGANVGEVTDQAARELMYAGAGTMFCLAGLGGDIEGMLATARSADVNLVLDGCPLECAKKVFDRHGLPHQYLRVTDLGIAKTKGVRATPEQIKTVTDKACAMLQCKA